MIWILLLIDIATRAASQVDNSTEHFEVCEVFGICACSIYYRDTETLPCLGECAAIFDEKCEDINYKSPYTDYCDYRPGDRCEDQCIRVDHDCSCGTEKFNIKESQTYCCNGKQQSINQPCESTNATSACYNSYQDSEYIGYSAHFSCPDVCVPILDMCQGISWCPEDVEVCDENLRVPTALSELVPSPLIEVEKLSMSQVNHQYFKWGGVGKINDRKYDVIDRSDEKKIKKDNEANPDFSELKFCMAPGSTIGGVKCVSCISKSEFCNHKSCDNIDFWVGYHHPLCIDEFDESNEEEFKERLNATIIIDATIDERQIALKFCSNSEVALGILCEKCTPRTDWCDGSPSVCGNFNNYAICRNSTFWEDSCPERSIHR